MLRRILKLLAEMNDALGPQCLGVEVALPDEEKAVIPWSNDFVGPEVGSVIEVDGAKWKVSKVRLLDFWDYMWTVDVEPA